jgi:hypothetical protein
MKGGGYFVWQSAADTASAFAGGRVIAPTFADHGIASSL